MVEIKNVDVPPAHASEGVNDDSRLSDLEETVAALVERVDTLEKKRDNKGLKDVRDRVEDVCDYLYGTNVRPPLTDRSDGEYAADVKPSNQDD